MVQICCRNSGLCPRGHAYLSPTPRIGVDCSLTNLCSKLWNIQVVVACVPPLERENGFYVTEEGVKSGQFKGSEIRRRFDCRLYLQAAMQMTSRSWEAYHIFRVVGHDGFRSIWKVLLKKSGGCRRNSVRKFE